MDPDKEKTNFWVKEEWRGNGENIN